MIRDTCIISLLSIPHSVVRQNRLYVYSYTRRYYPIFTLDGNACESVNIRVIEFEVGLTALCGVRIFVFNFSNGVYLSYPFVFNFAGSIV